MVPLTATGGDVLVPAAQLSPAVAQAVAIAIGPVLSGDDQIEVRRCSLKPVDTRVESAWCQLLKLSYDEVLSNLAFKFNSRRYMEGRDVDVAVTSYRVLGALEVVLNENITWFTASGASSCAGDGIRRAAAAALAQVGPDI